MFFGPGRSLERWLRERFPSDFRSWDGHSMEVHAVSVQGKEIGSVVCAVLRNNPTDGEGSRIHRVFVVNAESRKKDPPVVRGGESRWLEFRHHYLGVS